MNYLKPLVLYRELLKSNELKKEARLLGLDVGQKFIGVAISDTHNKIASPVSVLMRTKTNYDLMADDFLTFISRYSVEGFVVGYPYTYNKNTIDAFQVQGLVHQLNKTGKLEGVKYTYWDECLTSREVNVNSLIVVKSIELMLDPLNFHPYEYKTAIDKFAAVNILQGYLDYANRQSRPVPLKSSDVIEG